MARKSLSLDALVGKEKAQEPVTTATATAHPQYGEPVEKPAKAKKPSYREGKRAFTAWAHADAYRQLKHLATDKDTTVQALLEEGMDMVFHKYGYDQIAKQ